MFISELVERMLRVKEKYGDCRVFVLSKSFYENGTIMDARDTALTSIPIKGQDPEIIMMISNCPIIVNRDVDEATAELILRKGAVKLEDSDEPPTEDPQKIFISPEDIAKSFFLETDKYFLDLSVVEEFHEYITTKFHQGGFDNKHVIIDCNAEAFDRMAMTYSDMVDFVEDRNYLYLKCKDFTQYVDEFVHQLVIDFLDWKRRN